MEDSVLATGDDGERLFVVPSGARVEIDDDSRITTEIVIGLEDAVDRDLEQFLDFVAEAAVGSVTFMDFTYTVTGVTPEGLLILTVEGDVSEIINDEAEEAEYQREKNDGDS